jgi:uncharacterized RDD family membrane protein YckC
MEPSKEAVVETRSGPTSRIAGFWQRLGALAIDGLVLAAIGFPLGSLLGERLAPVGTPARLIGLLVILPYLAVLGSEVGNGQTFGKKLLRLRVVDGNGRPLPLSRALARATLLSLPWIFNGMRFGSLGPAVLATLWVAGVLVFGVGGAIVGTYVLNRRTRQAFHDLLVGSYVIHADGLGLRAPAASTRRPVVASIAWIALVAVATLAMGFAARRLLARAFPPVLLESVLAIPGASSAEIKRVETKQVAASGTARSSEKLVAVLWYRGPEEDTRRAANEVAAAILRHHPDAVTVPALAIKVVRGWDVGVARKTRAQSFERTPAEWQAELRR